MPPVEGHSNLEIERLLREHHELLKQNHALLRKMHSQNTWGFAFKIIWYAFLLSIPLVLYVITTNYGIPGIGSIEKAINAIAGACGF